MAAHRYWRMYMWLSAQGAMAMSEMEMHSTPGGGQIMSGGTISAASTFSGTAASNLLDGSINTAWSAAGPGVNWIEYDFGSGNAVTVEEIKLTATNNSNFTQGPTQLALQFSDDGATWATTWLVLNPPAWTVAAQVRTFTQATAVASSRYWAMSVDSSVGGSNPIIGPASFKLSMGGAKASPSSTAVRASSTYTSSGSFGPEQLVYGGSEWASNAAPTQWVDFNFGAAIAVVEVKLASTASYSTQSPSAFGLQYSNDGVSFTTIQSFTPASWTSSGQSQTFAMTNTPVSALFWRIDITATNAAGSPSLSAVSLATSSGGTNLVPLMSNGTAITASSPVSSFTALTTAAIGYPAFNVAGNTMFDPYQSGANSYPSWWTQDMGTAMQMAELSMGAVTSNYTEQPGNFAVLSSTDGTNYTTVKNFTSAAWASGVAQTFEIQPGATPPQASSMFLGL